MPRSLTSFHIKVLAALLMVFDHVGVVFFPDQYVFRGLGRLSFPLFCWLLVQGEAHTSNVWKYGLRLLGFGLISQPIFMIALKGQTLNILFTLLIGLVCLRLVRLTPQSSLPIWIAGGLLAEVIRVDYGTYGILVIAFIQQFKPEMQWWVSWIIFHLALLLLDLQYGSFQLPAVLAPLIVQFVSGAQGSKARWFYLFYPLHMLGIWCVSHLGLAH
jgi:hypothetical protein